MTTLPEGMTAQPMTNETVGNAVNLMNAYSQWLEGKATENVEEAQAMYAQPGFHMETDTQLVTLPDGMVVGIAEFWDMVTPHVRPFGWVRTHPDFFGRGIGTYLKEWAEARAEKMLPTAPEGARVSLLQSALGNDPVGIAFLQASGYVETRHFYNMRVTFESPPPKPALPEGLSIRSMAEGDERAFFHASWEAFKDHWGVVPTTFEAEYERRMARIKNDPDFDRSLWYAVWDGSEVAGICFNKIKTAEDPDMAWVNTLGVRRAWRSQGLGQALLLHSFGEFYRRGKNKAGLGVDATSLTGATRLYEKVGMRVYREFIQYEKVLRDGKELSTQEVE